METMKIDSAKKQVTPPAKPIHQHVAELAAMDGIPVYELLFSTPADLPIPESGGGTRRIRVRHDREITYLPKMMLYRVVQVSKDGPTVTFYVPRELAVFVPLEAQRL